MDLIFLAGVFIGTYFLGRLLEKVRIPWIFSSLIIGLLLSGLGLYSEAVSDPAFIFLSEMGMYFLLFIIGFELSLKEVFTQSRFILKVTIAMLVTETLLGIAFIHYIFGVDWLVSALVALSFATVGEALLFPVLDEFQLVETDLGQTLLGIGVLDDLLEIVTVVTASILVAKSAGFSSVSIWSNLFILLMMFGLVFLLVQLHRTVHVFRFKDIPSFFLFVIFFLFLFVGIGTLAEAAALGAFLAGIALRNLVQEKNLKIIDSETRTISYGLFAPVFFLWVGMSTDIAYMFDSFLLVILVMGITAVGKLAPCYLLGRHKLGHRRSILLGTGLMVKLSTSIVIIRVLYQNGLIGQHLYTVLISSTALFSILVPLILSLLLEKWNIGIKKVKVEEYA